MAISNSFSARAVAELLLIDHVGHFGDGVALFDGRSVYVPYTLGGETVEVAPVAGHPDRRRLLAIERASPERIAPFCRHFGVCGGCAIQHWDAERYRAWKRNLVVKTLAQAKLVCEVAPLIDAHGLGRRRITLHARMGTHDVLKVGFAAAGSHDIIPVDRCPIVDPALSGALAGASAAGIAATFYASNCTDDSPLFVATWYPSATLIVVSVGAVAGRCSCAHRLDGPASLDGPDGSFIADAQSVAQRA